LLAEELPEERAPEEEPAEECPEERASEEEPAEVELCMDEVDDVADRSQPSGASSAV